MYLEITSIVNIPYHLIDEVYSELDRNSDILLWYDAVYMIDGLTMIKYIIHCSAMIASDLLFRLRAYQNMNQDIYKEISSHVLDEDELPDSLREELSYVR